MDLFVIIWVRKQKEHIMIGNIAKVGTTETTDTVIKYTDVSVATNRFTLECGWITVEFFGGGEADFEAEFKNDEIVTDNLTMKMICDNLTETSQGGWHTILGVHGLVVEQVYTNVRTYDNGHIEESEIGEIVVDELDTIIPSDLEKEVA